MEKNLGHATAYGYAKSKGYSGTEEEFAELMADYASVGQSAAQSAEQAAASATSASGSATTASQAAQTATSKASEAVTAAGTATTKASEANQSASTASAAATSASTSAQTATTAATTATTKASEAAASATTATVAKTDAETARDAAAQSASRAEQSAKSIDPDEFNRKIYAAFATDTATGAIASFTDGADSIPMKDVLVHIEPVQEGSGDPSPDNIRPITGWTGAKVTRTGKNLLRLPTIEEIDNAPFVTAYKSIPLQLEPNTTYYLSTTFINGYTAKDKGMYWLITPTADKNDPWKAVAHSGQDSGKSDGTIITGDSGMLYLRFNGATKQRIDDLYANAQIQLEKGSTPTDYEPYSGQTYPITFPSEAGTVYGGTLDVTRGELMVDRAMVDLGTLSWTRINTSDSHWRFWTATTGMLENSTMISSQYVKIFPSAQWSGAIGIATQLINEKPAVMVSDERYETAQDFKTAMFGVQLVYELATPITYTLTPQEITSLLGTNNLWADTGDSDVEYRADTKLYITKKITDAVNALS